MKQLTDQELLNELTKRFDKTKKALSEVQKLNEELTHVNKKLEESESLKSHFISNITNEIVNPFASILALSKNILSVKKEDWKKVETMVSHIYNEAFHLDFQFRNIFAAAKLEAGEIIPEIQNIDIKSLFDSVIDMFTYLANKKDIKLQFELDCEKCNNNLYLFKSDPEKIRLIVSNLLSNAIKFSFEKSQIIIKVKKNKKFLVISVKDFGTGISPENQKIIFDRFKKLNSGIDSINRGHGLGLSVNKAMIDLLGGKIDIQTELNKGSVFTVAIPEYDGDIPGIAFDDNEFFFNSDEILLPDDDREEVF
ncbi:MAG: sensor histidine kinase [Bacteroidales bacterium]